MCQPSQNNPEKEQSPVEPSPTLEGSVHFPTVTYTAKAPQFLESARQVAQEAISEERKNGKALDKIYPVIMTKSFHLDPRMEALTRFIAQSAWEILSDQGYDMAPLNTYFTDFWCQEHYRHSAMEQHVHGMGAQIVGFYFLDVPKDSSRLVLHDPNAGKAMAGIRERDVSAATPASTAINFVPEPGMCFFANAWVPHSFSRHASSKPMRFIHFNINVKPTGQHASCALPPSAEVI